QSYRCCSRNPSSQTRRFPIAVHPSPAERGQEQDKELDKGPELKAGFARGPMGPLRRAEQRRTDNESGISFLTFSLTSASAHVGYMTACKKQFEVPGVVSSLTTVSNVTVRQHKDDARTVCIRLSRDRGEVRWSAYSDCGRIVLLAQDINPTES